MQYQCNEPFAGRNYNSPSSRPKPANKTNGEERSGCQAWRGAAKANLHAFPPALMGKHSLTDHLLPDWPEAPLKSSQVSAKGFRMQQGQCPTSGCEGRDGGDDTAVHATGISRYSGGADPLPRSTPIAEQKCWSWESRCLHGQGERPAPFGASACKVRTLGPKGTHATQPCLPYNHIIPFPPESHPGPLARQAAHGLRRGCET